MNRKAVPGSSSYIKGNKRRRAWHKVVQIMSGVVVFCTTYALILPAITLETPTSCGMEEHTHTESCYIQLLDQTTHEHTEQCYQIPEGHIHAEACYAQQRGSLICQEVTEHIHSDACRGSAAPVCANEEAEHVHDESCYEAACTLTEGHEHTNTCYEWSTVLACDQEEAQPVLVCTEGETSDLTCTLDHTHSALCYGKWELACPKQEHAHSLICFSDPEADTETEKVWKRTLPDLTGVYVDDVLAAAESQLDYTESKNNYTVLDDGMTMKGYTRYGDWYGDPYGKWDGMFASFCLYYAGANELEALKDFPLEADAAEWVRLLQENEEENTLFLNAEDGTPAAGDLVFFDRVEDELNEADHVAIVIGIAEAEDGTAFLRVYEGDCNDRVQENAYTLDDETIVGYGLLPEVPDYIPAEPAADLHTFSDDTVYVEVQLPEDTDVPEDAVLKVAPISAEDESYAAYVAQAEAAVEGTVANIALYDISFYTADDDYIPVSDTADVTMGFVDSPVDAAANVQVLHFAEAEAAPAQLTDVTVEERELEMHLPDTQPAPIAEPEAEAVQFSLRTILSEARSIEPLSTEPETATVTETRTVIEFTTDGFSTFAVVQVQTGSYTATALTNDEIKAITSGTAPLNNRTFVIGPDYKIKNVTYALTNETVTIHEDYPNNAEYDHEFERLKAGEVKVNGNTITTPADDGFLWKFIKVNGDNTYYIQSVETGQYLYIGPGRTVKTTATPNPIVVGYKGNTANNLFKANVSLRAASGQYLNCYDDIDSISEGFKVFDAKENDNSWNEVFLAEYIEKENENFAQWPLDGKQIVISRWYANDNKAWVMTNVGTEDGRVANRSLLQAVEKDVTVDASGNLSYATLLGDAENATWKFTKVDGQYDTYYIESANKRYLNLSVREGTVTEDGKVTEESSLTLSNEPQAIKVTYNNNGTVILSASVDGNTRYVNHYEYRGFGCYNNGTQLTLTEYAPTDLAGRQFIISRLLDENGYSTAVMSQEANGTGLYAAYNACTPDKDGNPVPAVGAVVPQDVLWQFETAENSNSYTYYIKAGENGYLNIDENGALTVGATQQAIEVVCINGNRVALRVLDNETGTYRYVSLTNAPTEYNLYGTFGTAQGIDANSTLALTEYPVPNEVALVTNLADKIGILCAVDTPADWPYSAIVTDKPTDEGTFTDGRAGLQTVPTNPDMVEPDDPAYNTVVLGDYSNMIWKIIGTDVAGQYYIQSQTTGKYLHLDANGATLSDEPQTLEIIRASTIWWPNAICVRASVNGINYYLNLYDNDYTKPVSAWSFEGKDTPGDRSNNFVFAELSEEEMTAIKVVTDQIDALPNQEALVNSVKDLLDADPSKYHDRDLLQEAHDLQTNTIAAASAAIDAYDELTDEQKLFVGIDRINKLEELREWLLDESAEGDDSGDSGEDSGGDGGEGGETTETGRLPNVVPADTASGVTVKLFNYSDAVTSEKFYTDGFKFFNQSGNSEDGYGDKSDYVDKVHINQDGTYNPNITYKLNDDGYPVLVDGDKQIDLTNLFNGNYQVATMSDGGGLFRQDENGYYFYYSDMNAAYYDQKKNEFILYDTIVRPGNASWNNDNLRWDPSDTYESDRRSNFLPFNALINPDGTSSIIYDSEYHQENNEENIAITHGLKLTDEPEQVPTAVLNDRTDLWFGMNIEFNFLMPEGGKLNGDPMMFDFHGDDDVWVFIDGVPVLDLSGTHAAWDGSINFATGEVRNQYDDMGDGTNTPKYTETTLKKLFMEAAGVTDESVTSVTINGKTIAFNGNTLADYTAHNLKFFYLERGGFISYSGIKFNMPTLPNNSLIVNKVAPSVADQNTDFQFRVVVADGEGKPVYNNDGSVNVFLKEGTTFTIKEDGKDDREGTVGEGGIFTLKHGQSAVFTDVSKANEKYPEKTPLVVQEILGSGHAYNVSYLLGSDGTITPVQKDQGDNIDNTGSSNYSSGSFNSIDDHEIVTYYNTPEGSGTLKIAKQRVKPITDDEEIFYVRVRMGQTAADTLIPVGTQYHIGTETKYVKEPGIIELKAGETAEIIGITPNLHYEVAEFLVGDQIYKPEYGVTETNETGTVKRGSASVSGIIQANEEVAITIENDKYAKSVKLPITKEVKPAGVPDNFYFLVDQVVSQTNLDPVKEYRPGVLVQVGASGKSDANIMIGVDDGGPWYFKVYEEETTSNYFYDPTFYIVKVDMVNGEAKITQVWKNGTGEPITDLIDNALPFVNRKFTKLTVEKTVVNVVDQENTGGTFNFDVIVDAGGIPYIPEGQTAKDEEKPAEGFTITLSNNESQTFQIPYGSKVQVTETNNAGYHTLYEVYSRYEAEDGVLSNEAQVGENANASGGKYVHNIGANNGAGAVTIFPNMLSGGNYSIRLQYNTLLNRSFRVIVNNDEPIEEECVGHWADAWYLEWFNFDLPEKIRLEKGTNTIGIRGTDGTDAYAPNLDYVDIILTEEKGGITATRDSVTDPITIHFTNQTGYELPETGGTGTYLYTIGGLMLMMAAAILLYSKTKRGKEELASS